MNKMIKKWSKKQKIGVASACVVVLVLIGGSMALANTSNTAGKVQEETEQTKDAVYQKELTKALTTLYLDSTYTTLSEDVTPNQLAEIKALLVEHSTKIATNTKSKKARKLEDEVATGVQMWDIQTKLDSFVEPAGEIKEASGYSTIELDAIMEALQTMKETKVDFYEEKKSQTAKIKAEFQKINEAKALVDGFFVEGEPTTVKEEITREQLDVAKGKVSEIRQPSLKAQLESQLVVAETALSEREAVVASEEKAAQEAAVVAEQAAQQAQASAANSAAQSAEPQGSSNVGTGYTAPQESPSNSEPVYQAPPASNPGGNGSWSGNGNVTGGGQIGGSQGSNSEGNANWTDGDFDGSGINTDGWN